MEVGDGKSLENPEERISFAFKPSSTILMSSTYNNLLYQRIVLIKMYLIFKRSRRNNSRVLGAAMSERRLYDAAIGALDATGSPLLINVKTFSNSLANSSTPLGWYFDKSCKNCSKLSYASL
uniref:Uncharacterized protein n=1 Tax=Romanomermis culicivorax TaxID=13658 RepID=A0A915J224_ROMCU